MGVEKQLIGCDGTRVRLAPQGHLSAQNQAFIVGEGPLGAPLLIWRPFSSLSHLQVGAHTAKTPTTTTTTSSSAPSPSCLFVSIPHPSISPHRCFPPRLFTISPFHFVEKICSIFLLVNSLSSLLFCLLWIYLTLPLSTSFFYPFFFFTRPPSIPSPPSPSAIPIYL